MVRTERGRAMVICVPGPRYPGGVTVQLGAAVTVCECGLPWGRGREGTYNRRV